MSGIIKVDTSGHITVHDFPDGDIGGQTRALAELIGCEWIEHVMPRRLYRLGFSNDPREPNCISMLIDEEGRLKPNKINVTACALYGHTIVGNVLFVRDEWTEDGTVFTGIRDEDLKTLKGMLDEIV